MVLPSISKGWNRTLAIGTSFLKFNESLCFKPFWRVGLSSGMRHQKQQQLYILMSINFWWNPQKKWLSHYDFLDFFRIVRFCFFLYIITQHFTGKILNAINNINSLCECLIHLEILIRFFLQLLWKSDLELHWMKLYKNSWTR